MLCYIYNTNTRDLKGAFDLVEPKNISFSLSGTDDVVNNCEILSFSNFDITSENSPKVLDLIWFSEINQLGIIDSVNYNSREPNKLEIFFRLGIQFRGEQRYHYTGILDGVTNEALCSVVKEVWTSSQYLSNQHMIYIYDSNVDGYLFLDNSNNFAHQNEVYRKLINQGIKIIYDWKEHESTIGSYVYIYIYKPQERKIWDIYMNDILDYDYEFDSSQPNTLRLYNSNYIQSTLVSLKNNGEISLDVNDDTVQPIIETCDVTETTATPSLDVAIAKLTEFTYQNSLNITVSENWAYDYTFKMYPSMFDLIGDGVVIHLSNDVEIISIVDTITYKGGVIEIKLGQSSQKIFYKGGL